MLQNNQSQNPNPQGNYTGQPKGNNVPFPTNQQNVKPDLPKPLNNPKQNPGNNYTNLDNNEFTKNECKGLPVIKSTYNTIIASEQRKDEKKEDNTIPRKDKM